jgi:hypothetical protein
MESREDTLRNNISLKRKNLEECKHSNDRDINFSADV